MALKIKMTHISKNMIDICPEFKTNSREDQFPISKYIDAINIKHLTTTTTTTTKVTLLMTNIKN